MAKGITRHDTLMICYAQATGEGEDDENKHYRDSNGVI
jgi:hypothetical protein